MGEADRVRRRQPDPFPPAQRPGPGEALTRGARGQDGEQRAVDLIQAAGVGAVRTLLSTPPERRDPGLGEAMYEAVLGHILTEPPERPGSGPKATAVAFRAIAPRLDALSDAERHVLSEWLGRVTGDL